MLHLFGRNDDDGRSAAAGPSGPVLPSHILIKFLKRLRGLNRPYLLDLGRLSGANIEFFARAGCKVQVEDLLLPSDPAAGEGRPPDPSRDGGPARASGDNPGPAIPRLSEAAPRAAAAPAGPPPAAARAETPPGAVPAAAEGRPGARPSRRIVLPPRTFGNVSPPAARGPAPAPRAGAVPGPERGPAAVQARRLPTSFAYPDETFDAVIAWDVFNYYDPASAHRVAAETRRILKPGGLVLSYFHARRFEAPQSPARYRILDDRRVAFDPGAGPRLACHLYQNRDIEKLFTGLSIVELYFLKNSMREILMEKKVARLVSRKPLVQPAETKPPRFTID